MASVRDVDVSAQWPHHINNPETRKNTYPYSPSIASAASSSSDSVFSVDAPSSQSSECSSDAWLSSSEVNEFETIFHQFGESTIQAGEAHPVRSCSSYSTSQLENSIRAVAPESRQHPRRTQRLNSWGSQDGKNGPTCVRAPPSLVRQSERKDNFVDSLVGKLTDRCSRRGKLLTNPSPSRHHHPDDRDDLAPFCVALCSGNDCGQTAKSDRSTHLRARSTEEIENELLDFTSRTVLPDTCAIVHTET